MVLAVPFYAAGIVLASLSRLALTYPGIGDLDRRFVSPRTGSGLSPSTAMLLEPPVVPACFSTLWLGAVRRCPC